MGSWAEAPARAGRLRTRAAAAGLEPPLARHRPGRVRRLPLPARGATLTALARRLRAVAACLPRMAAAAGAAGTCSSMENA